MRFENMAFANERIELDGNEYVGCRFDSCTFVYSATGNVEFGNNSVSVNSEFVFRGAASNTLEMLKMIYTLGEAGRKTVLRTFQEIAPSTKKPN